MKTDKELQENNPLLYKVAREHGTEAPFSGDYVAEKGSGTYHCAVCGASLFSSDTKFDSNTGWPSFTDPENREAVTLREDTSLGMSRVEVLCKNCGAHLGHVFNDGPKLNEKVCDRYCINSVSLEFKKNE
jgi:peptide-methionine (R)-S-oxide reductase